MSTRKFYLYSFIISILLLSCGYFFQYIVGLKPCALCILQRMTYYFIAIISLLAVWLNPNNIKQKIMAVLLGVVALSGVLIAGRQVWLQHFPPRDLGCGPNLSFMLHNFPLSQVVRTLFYGTGDCALVTQRLLGLSMAEWSLLFLTGFLVLFLMRALGSRF